MTGKGTAVVPSG